jgi:hypothetical protein
MQLPKTEVDRFFKLMWSLQCFVNQQQKIHPKIQTIEAYKALSRAEKLPVRDALYDNSALIDDYVKANPQGFMADELAIVESWQHFVRGDFYIERLLKKYAIFINGEDVYGVLALYDAFDEMIAREALPQYVKAVLLPYKGQIIYDGLLQGYSLFFGGGITGELKETYMAAKQNGRIIVSLEKNEGTENNNAKGTARQQPAKDWGPTLEALLQEANKLRAGNSDPAIYSPAFSLAKASLELAKLAVEHPDDLDALWKALKKVERARSKAETVLYRAE